MSFLKILAQSRTYYLTSPCNKSFNFLLSRSVQKAANTFDAEAQYEAEPFRRKYYLYNTFKKTLTNTITNSGHLTNKQAAILIGKLNNVVSLSNKEKNKIITEIESQKQNDDIEYINALLKFYNHNKLSFDINIYLNKIEAKEINANPLTYGLLIEALCLDSQVEKAQQLLANAISNNFILNSSVYGNIIAAHCRSGKVKDPINALEVLRSKGVEINKLLIRSISCSLCTKEQENCLISLLDYSNKNNVFLDAFDLVKIATELKKNNNSQLLPKILSYFNIDEPGFGYTFLFLIEHNEFKSVLFSLLEDQPKPLRDSFLAEPVYQLVLDRNDDAKYDQLSQMFLEKQKTIPILMDIAIKYKMINIVKSCLLEINEFNYTVNKHIARRTLAHPLGDEVTQFLLDKNLKLCSEDMLKESFWSGPYSMKVLLAANRLCNKNDSQVALRNYFQNIFSDKFSFIKQMGERNNNNLGSFLCKPQQFKDFNSEVYTKTLLEFLPKIFNIKTENTYNYTMNLKTCLKKLISKGKFLPTNKDEVLFTEKMEPSLHSYAKILFCKNEEEINSYNYKRLDTVYNIDPFKLSDSNFIDEMSDWHQNHQSYKEAFIEFTLNDWINYCSKNKNHAKFKILLESDYFCWSSCSQALTNKILMECIDFGDEDLVRNIHRRKLVDDDHFKVFHINSIPLDILQDENKVRAMQAHLEQLKSKKNASFWCLYFSYLQHGLKEKALELLNIKIKQLSEGQKGFQMHFADPVFVQRHLSESVDKLLDVFEQCNNLKFVDKLHIYNHLIYHYLQNKDFESLEYILKDFVKSSPEDLSDELRKVISCKYQLAGNKTPECLVAENEEQELVYRFSGKSFAERLECVKKLKEKIPFELVKLHFSDSLTLEQYQKSFDVFQEHFPDNNLNKIEEVLGSYFSAQLQENKFNESFEFLKKVLSEQEFVDEVFLNKQLEKVALKAVKTKNKKLLEKLKNFKVSNSRLNEKINSKVKALILYYRLFHGLNLKKNNFSFKDMLYLVETIKNEDESNLVDKLYENAWIKINSGDSKLFSIVNSALMSHHYQLEKVQSNLSKCICEDGYVDHRKYYLTETFQRALSKPLDMKGLLASLEIYGQYKHFNIVDQTWVMNSFFKSPKVFKAIENAQRCEKIQLLNFIEKIFDPESVPASMLDSKTLKILPLLQHGLRFDTPVRFPFFLFKKSKNDNNLKAENEKYETLVQHVESETK